MEGRGNKPAATGETRAASRGKQSLKGRLRDSLRPDATFSVGLNGETEAFKLAVASRRCGIAEAFKLTTRLSASRFEQFHARAWKGAVIRPNNWLGGHGPGGLPGEPGISHHVLRINRCPAT
jgi:hypothetical protein